MNQPKRIAVIGAGPAGITAGYQLSKNPEYSIHLYEASSSVGGLAKSLNLWNQTVDLGPHRFFSSDKRVNVLWLEVVGNDYHMVERLTRILYNRQFYFYPLKPFDALSKLGLYEAVRCLWSFMLQQRGSSPKNSSFEAWVTSRFGKRLFQIFFKTYSEKLWGIPCSDLDSDFAAQRIKKLSLFEVVKNAFKWTATKGEHKTLVEQFAYPIEGTGMVYRRMESSIRKNGGKVYLSTPVKKVVTEHGKVRGLELEVGGFEPYDHVVSSMPLTLLVERLNEVPESIIQRSRRLKFRNTILVYLLVDHANLFPDNWLYIHSPELHVGRITNFRNWVPQLYGSEHNTILALEYWCNDDDEMWTRKNDNIIDLAKRELVLTQLMDTANILEGHVVRISRCYPVYARGYKEYLKPIEQYLMEIEGLSVIGRYGV